MDKILHDDFKFTLQLLTLLFVVVRMCRSLPEINDGYFICHPGGDYRYGSSCTFGCYDGHELVGASNLQCLESGDWSAPIPKCQSKARVIEPKINLYFSPSIDKALLIQPQGRNAPKSAIFSTGMEFAKNTHAYALYAPSQR